jgi:hypothetical protein
MGSPPQPAVAKKLHAWFFDVGLFVRGYILHKVCDHIDTLQRDLTYNDREKEIWLTSLESIAVMQPLSTRGTPLNLLLTCCSTGP